MAISRVAGLYMCYGALKYARHVPFFPACCFGWMTHLIIITIGMQIRSQQQRFLSSKGSRRRCFRIVFYAFIIALLLLLCNFWLFLGGSNSLDEIISTVTIDQDATGSDYAVNSIRNGNIRQIDRSNLKNANEPIQRVLDSAKITSTKPNQLPKWRDITSMYGDKPVIHGIETCEHYREMVKPEDRTMGPAGLFNTGTNLMWKLMTENCDIDGEILFQAPWGKHSPASSRLKRVAWSGKGINQTEFFPFMMIKDPFSWMNSQCRHDYGVTFWASEYDKEHCPNLIRANVLDRDETAPVKLFESGLTQDSLLDVYNFWYGQWEAERTKNFPHLTIRYEDLLFHGEEVSRIACECVGGNFVTDFNFESQSAKESSDGHEGSSDLIKALIQYGDPAKRLNGFTDRDIKYARTNVATAKLMEEYGYNYPVLE